LRSTPTTMTDSAEKGSKKTGFGFEAWSVDRRTCTKVS
jgi:hypothetical protein